ncbi:MAG: tetratricopeptide repeat protein, partial [Planctomycetes bacterium]|nr:tetratricopeptide repeat protein [Planctomycetota bacterium]
MSPNENPQRSEFLNEAKVLHQQGRLAEAEPMYRRILKIDPQQPDALHLLGLLVHQQGHNEAAAELIQSAIAVAGSVAEYYNSLGAVFKAQGKLVEAVTPLRQALAINRELPLAWNNLAEIYLVLHRIEEANEALQKANPKVARQLLMAHLQNLLRAGGLDEFDAVLDTADALFPDDVELEAARLFRFHFDETLEPEELTEAFRRWAGKHFPVNDLEEHPRKPHIRLRETEENQNKIRIAYVGTYLHFMFIEKILLFHNVNRFEVFLLTDDKRLNAKALEGRVRVAVLSEIDPVTYCREQKIDIAVDMVGPFPFSNGMRQFAAFQKRLAPIQCSWIATTGTSGSTMIDY